MKRELGGKRLGAGNALPSVILDGIQSSNHDLSRINRFGATPGILYPVCIEEALAGDKFNLGSQSLIKTVPTIGPLFGSFKAQLDWFFVPLRLYCRELHNNALNFNPSNSHWPKITITGPSQYTKPKPRITSITVYTEDTNVSKLYNETFYPNKMGWVEIPIGIPQAQKVFVTVNGENLDKYFIWYNKNKNLPGDIIYYTLYDIQAEILTDTETVIKIQALGNGEGENFNTTYGGWFKASESDTTTTNINRTGSDLQRAQINPSSLMHFLGLTGLGTGTTNSATVSGDFNAIGVMGYYDIFKNYYANTQETTAKVCNNMNAGDDPNIESFTLANIDTMRKTYLSTDSASVAKITTNSIMPFQCAAKAKNHMGGLVCKTYQSDRFNSWLNTTTVTSITNQTMVAVTSNQFSIDALRLANKVNEMLQRTLVSGGTWTDWLKVQYGDSVKMQCEIPEWIGSTSGEIVFEDVTATTENGDQPLGAIAGKGHGSWKKGRATYHVNEPGVIMAIFSITPRVDYSMGNRAYLRRKTLNDNHIPAMDAIGFQDLLTEEFAAFDTYRQTNASYAYKAIGKQPAWTEYMTATNETHGSFAIGGAYSWMALNREYHADESNRLIDGTSYVDPTLYNQIFADTSLTAENFWVQIAFKIHARRAMSKKVMPKL